MPEFTSAQPTLPPLEAQSDLEIDTDERYSTQTVEEFRRDPERFAETHEYPRHHYSQTQNNWGGAEAVGELLSCHGIDPTDLTVTIFGGFTGEFAGAVRDLDAEVIFTDPMAEWVEQARSDGFESYACPAELIPGDVVAKSGAIATFECYYPFQTDPAYSLYNALRFLSTPEGLLFAEGQTTREVREESGAGQCLPIFEVIGDYLELDWKFHDHGDLRLHQYSQPEETRHQSFHCATVLSQIYGYGSPESETHIHEGTLNDLVEMEPPYSPISYARYLRAMYKDALGELGDILPPRQMSIGSREFHLDF